MKQAFLTTPQADGRIRVGKRNAYHQAGHAAAIYLGNQQKQLPAVFFQIVIQPYTRNRHPVDRLAGLYSQLKVSVEGGRLVQNNPLSFTDAAHYCSLTQQEKYHLAFEADVVNLLAGSLAEARYVTESDNEAFNPSLINLRALHFYGGSADLEVILDYIVWFLPDKEERDRKLNELFLEAFNFVNQQSNWHAISALASYIQEGPYDILTCEEVIAFLDSRIAV